MFLALVEGNAVGEIATALNLSIKTISTHKAHLLKKMQAQSVAELVRYAMVHALKAQS